MLLINVLLFLLSCFADLLDELCIIHYLSPCGQNEHGLHFSVRYQVLICLSVLAIWGVVHVLRMPCRVYMHMTLG